MLQIPSKRKVIEEKGNHISTDPQNSESVFLSSSTSILLNSIESLSNLVKVIDHLDDKSFPILVQNKLVNPLNQMI